jgi:signal recognition particle receptor subunit beta
MSRKRPSQIRKDLEAARARVNTLIGVLQQNESERRWGLGDECSKAIGKLQALLRNNQAPREYKVAVIGLFKAGKSTFVNVLLDQTLAGEDTNPETAAVTTFRAGGRVLARINFIDKAAWDELKVIYRADPSDPAAHRIANWFKLERAPRAGSSGQNEIFDLAQLEREYVKPGAHTLTIAHAAAQGREAERKAKSDFQRGIRQFTSSTKPHHCLVESIEIETPSSLLGEGVILIDTPGLGDTERFRVHLTERAVEDVDAVLFLTKSGASYGQSEKDFVLSLLRKGTIKQLVFVVTQIDQTYEQHVRQARDQFEEPEPISARITAERTRLQREIEATLNELAAEAGSASVDRYRDQLNSVEISFTSAANHRDALRKEPVRSPLTPDDPGGMRDIKETLYRILSTESRLAATKQIIQSGVSAILHDMLSVIEARRGVVAGLKSTEVAENKLATFRGEFDQNGKQFAEVTKQDGVLLQTTLANRAEIQGHVAELIAMQADEVLASYEIDDAARHWRTRRGGRWGHMHELQTRVANRIFPKVTAELNKQTDAFGEFVNKFRAHLGSLSDEARATIVRLDIGEELQFDIASSLEAFLAETLQTLQQLVEGEELQIVALLEEFVDDQVENRIADARERVASVWGRGTTAGQTAEVRAFYAEVRSILKEALKSHVRKRFEDFGRHLTAQANAVPERTLSEVGAQIERTSVNIRAAAEATVSGQKGDFQRLSGALTSAIATSNTEISILLDDDVDDQIPDGPAVQPPAPIAPPIVAPGATLADIQRHATQCVQRHTLKNNAKRWPWSRIVPAEYFRGATQAWLIDPYLTKHFQRRNLAEFVMAVLDGGAKLKTLTIITREVSDTSPDADKLYYDALDRDAFEKAGMRVVHTIDGEIHDRFFTLDNGFVFKLGRGLDIYKPAAGLATRDSGLRQVRACEIDVFGPPPK